MDKDFSPVCGNNPLEAVRATLCNILRNFAQQN
jgi:hypothetical protein